ncbi:hypothetical protein [Tenacibaculum sp. M341]
MYGNKNYLGKGIFAKLNADGLHLVSKLRKNIKKENY